MFHLSTCRPVITAIAAFVLAATANDYVGSERSLLTAKAGDLAPHQNPAQGRYRVVHGWPLLPDGYILGQGTGVGVDSQDNVFAFHRAGRVWDGPLPSEPIQNATIMLFDGKTGKLLNSWGENMFIMPHGLTVDHQDNVWVTDVGRHQIFKFSHDGKLLLTLGTRDVPGADNSHFNRPTDVAVLQDGSFYVSDGYRNTRVLKFSADGRFQFEWGRKGIGPGEFNLPHGIATDNRGRVYVCDRSNSRVQVFDPGGKFLSEWKSKEMGRPYGIAIGVSGDVFVVDGGDQPTTLPDRAGAVRMDQNGTVLESFGSFGNYDGQFNLAHDIAVDRKGAVYVIDTRGMRVQKFIRVKK